MLTEPILSHESEYPFPVVPTILKLAGQGTSDSADSRTRLVLYEPAHSGSITHLVDTIDRHHIGTESCPEISIQQQNGSETFTSFMTSPTCHHLKRKPLCAVDENIRCLYSARDISVSPGARKINQRAAEL
ncbi:hypothetical protein M8J77_025690 [Diaphorina citri]|nr:hypothetical protein M8J77_025690 [Diaphorina citri]